MGDFGLSKQLDVEKYNCYVQKKEVALPNTQVPVSKRIRILVTYFSVPPSTKMDGNREPPRPHIFHSF